MAEKEEKTVTEAEEAKEAKKATKAKSKKVEEEAVEENLPLRDEATAVLRNYGATPRKVRLVIDLIRGKDIDEAYAILDNTNKICAPAIKKLIKSCEANAVNNFHMNRDGLYISYIAANDGIKLKRYMPRAKGSASGLVKRWSHIYVTLRNREAL